MKYQLYLRGQRKGRQIQNIYSGVMKKLKAISMGGGLSALEISIYELLLGTTKVAVVDEDLSLTEAGA